jgi:hypothetical protein
LPPRWPAVQVVKEFLLRAAAYAQGVPGIFSKFFLPSTVRRLLSPGNAPYPPDIHSYAHSRLGVCAIRHPGTGGPGAPLAPAHSQPARCRTLPDPPLTLRTTAPAQPGAAHELAPRITPARDRTGARSADHVRMADSGALQVPLRRSRGRAVMTFHGGRTLACPFHSYMGVRRP